MTQKRRMYTKTTALPRENVSIQETLRQVNSIRNSY